MRPSLSFPLTAVLAIAASTAAGLYKMFGNGSGTFHCVNWGMDQTIFDGRVMFTFGW